MATAAIEAQITEAENAIANIYDHLAYLNRFHGRMLMNWVDVTPEHKRRSQAALSHLQHHLHCLCEIARSDAEHYDQYGYLLL